VIIGEMEVGHFELLEFLLECEVFFEGLLVDGM
jgi:hypothetical protein